MIIFQELQSQMQKFSELLSNIMHDKGPSTKVQLCISMLNAIQKDPHRFDGSSVIAFGKYGIQFESIVKLSSKETILETIDILLEFLSCVARESELRRGSIYPEPVRSVVNYYSLSNPALSTDEKEHADFLFNRLPRIITEDFIKKLSVQGKEIDDKIDNWSKSLESWDLKIKTHEANLKNFRQRYNFVELSKAFNQMFFGKRTEKRITLSFVILFGIFLVIVPCLVIYLSFIQTNNEVLKKIQDMIVNRNLLTLVPILTIEVMLLYYFRILLHNYYSVKAQLLQLDHRQSLCAFIESYAEFAKGKQDLSRFEALIFSGLSPDIKNIPSTFDALEQLTRVVKEIKKT